MSPSRTRVHMVTQLPNKSNSDVIVTDSSSWTDGDTPQEKQIAGITAGLVGQGIAISHGRYFADKGKPVVYRNGLVE